MTQLMTHLYFGDPTPKFSLKLAQSLVEGGADILEIGIPYSDPVSDGEVFQRVCKRALAQGITPPAVFAGIETLRKNGITKPIYVTSYFGPVFKMGIKVFVRRVKNAGAQGVIIPDLLLEEQNELLKIAGDVGISVIQFATPYSSQQRLKEIISVAKDFIYCVGVPGVTGVRNQVDPRTLALLTKVKVLTHLPVFVGFGISKPTHVEVLLHGGADGVIVGSAIGRIYERYLSSPNNSLSEIAEFTRSLKRSTYGKR